MKKIKRWRYYCDHCGKSGGSKWHMEKHEKVCTKNHDRECGFCGHLGNGANTKNLIRIAKAGAAMLEKNMFISDWDETIFDKQQDKVIKVLTKHADGCPACILAALRLGGEECCLINFDYKKTKEQFWKDHPQDTPDY